MEGLAHFFLGLNLAIGVEFNDSTPVPPHLDFFPKEEVEAANPVYQLHDLESQFTGMGFLAGPDILVTTFHFVDEVINRNDFKNVVGYRESFSPHNRHGENCVPVSLFGSGHFANKKEI